MRVLLIDADPQGNLTSVAAAEPVEEDQAGLADVLSDKTTDQIRDVAVAGIWPGMDLVPTAGATLGAVRDELIIAGAGRESRLKTALAAVVDDYDLVLLDCAPSLDQLAVNALVAAHGVLVLTEAKLFAANGLGQLLTTIAAVRDYYNPQLKVTGVLVNRLEERTVSSAVWLDELHEAATTNGLTVLTPIPKRVVIADAAEAARGLDEWGTADAVTIGTIYTDHLHAIEGALTVRMTVAAEVAKAFNERQEQEAQAPDMPAAFEARAGAMWREAYTLAQAHFAAERKGWEGQVKAAQGEAAELAADLDEVETQRDAAQQAGAEAAQRVDELRGRLDRTEGQAEDRKAEAERLRDELRDLRAQLDQERTRADRAEARAEALIELRSPEPEQE